MRRTIFFSIFMFAICAFLYGCNNLTNSANSNIENNANKMVEDYILLLNNNILLVDDNFETENSMLGMKKVLLKEWDESQNYHEYTYNIYGDCIRVAYYTLSGEQKEIIEYEYDENRNCVKCLTYENNECHDWIEYVYNREENTIKTLQYLNDELWGWKQCEYDKNDNLIKEIDYYGNGNIDRYKTYKYDESNNLIQVSCFYADNTPISVCDYVYDENNNLICETYSGDLNYSSPYTHKVEYEYDQTNKLIKTTSYESQYDITDWKMGYSIYEYDVEGRVKKVLDYTIAIGLSREEYLGSGEAWLSMYTEYEYDEEGDILKITETQVNDLVGENTKTYDIAVFEYQYIDITE